jgi:hypothetical protein
METQLRLITTIYSYAVLFSIIKLFSMWRIYKKAGQPGWAALVPFYNIVIWLRIISKPAWWLALLFIPIVNIVILVLMTNLLAKKFDRNTGFTFGLILLGIIFYPILAFKEYKYSGNIEIQSNFIDDPEVKRDKLIIWSLVLLCIGGLFWFILGTFVKDWWRYYYLHIPVSTLFLFPYFLIAISVGNKKRTTSIVLSVCFIIIYCLYCLLPLIKELILKN